MNFVPELGLSRERREVHGVYIPEMALDIAPRPRACARSWISMIA